MKIDDYIAGGAGLSGMIFSWLFGEFDGVVQLLFVLMVIDQITGVIKAGVLKTWDSSAGFNGIARKVMMLCLVCIANLIDKEFHTGVLRDGVAFFYVANEGVSIIENAIEMKAPVPEWLKERFVSWRNRQPLSKNSSADSED